MAVKALVFILVIYLSKVEVSAGKNWPEYHYNKELRGWFKLHPEPADWDTADATCRGEGAVLAPAWGPQYTTSINKLQETEDQSISVLFSGSRMKSLEAYTHGLDNAPTLTQDPKDLREFDRCVVFFANGTTGTVHCQQRLPYVCFAVASQSTCGGQYPILARPNRPDYDFCPNLRGWFKLHREPADWQAARIRCHDEDALLAAPWSPEFTAAINELQSTDDRPIPALYTGSQVTFSGSIYRYLNGKSRTKSSAADSEVLELCVVLYSNGTTGEVGCTERFPFVCYAAAAVPREAPKSPAPPKTLVCGDADLHYEFSNVMGHCYKLHMNAELWTDAYKICREEGGYLAVLNSEAEARVLHEIFEANRLRGVNCTNRKHCFNAAAAIGFVYWKESGTYQTIHGQTLEQAGYSTWWAESDVRGRGYMYFDGGLYQADDSCYAPFFCERGPVDSAADTLPDIEFLTGQV